MSDDGFFAEPATLFLSDADVAELADWPAVIGALAEAYARPDDPQATPDRVVLPTATGWQRVMPSAPPGAQFAGSKTISASTKNGLVSYLITLFDQHDSRLAALIDGNRITGLRTAGAAAAALSKLAPARPLVVAVIGSGFEARAQLRAASKVCTFTEVRVSSPTAANRERFAAELSAELGVSVTAVESAQEAVRGADLILCAARSRDESPTLMSEWVGDNAIIVSVGSTTPSQFEIDPVLIGRAKLVVADALHEVLEDSGDMIATTQAGFEPAAFTVSLHDVMGGGVTRPDAGIVIYKSTGSGFQDLVIAELLYNRAVAQGVGTPLPGGVLTIRK
jgi:alanine dehydrogenase